MTVLAALVALLGLVAGCDVLRRRDEDSRTEYRSALYAGGWFLAAVIVTPALL